MIKLVVQASLALLVISLGLQARFSDATFLFRHPRLLARSVVSMNLILPLLALWVAVVFALNPGVKLALVCLAVSPMPPFLPGTASRAGGDRSYTVGLLVATSVLATVVIPVTLLAFEALFGVPVTIPQDEIFTLLVVGILLPLFGGLVIRRLAPGFAARMSRPVAMLATVMLVAGLVPVLMTAWPAMWSLVGNGTLVAILLLTVAGLATGHWLGRPRLADRAVLGLATASRHPAVAIAIGDAVFPGERRLGAAVLLAVLVGAAVTLPYSRWMRRRVDLEEFHPLLRRHGAALTPRSMTARSVAQPRAVTAKAATRGERVEPPSSANDQKGDAGPKHR